MMGYINPTNTIHQQELRENSNYDAPYVYGLAPAMYFDRCHHWRKTILLMVPT
jgi:hypothetical protein